jgi:cytidylate kinase
MTRFSIGPVLAAVRSVPVPPKPFSASGVSLKPFLTISREPGAGAIGVGTSFVEAMNAESSQDEHWTYWDREIVGKVAADHHLSTRLIEGLEDKNHSWMGQFLSSLSFTDTGPSQDEDAIYSRVRRTIEKLAEAGRVVIVGRGGVFITRHMPGGIHVRLVAPLKDRIAYIARSFGLSERNAAARIREVDHNRHRFFKMHWPTQTLAPENFALTINTAEVEIGPIVAMLRSLVQQKVAPTAKT